MNKVIFKICLLVLLLMGASFAQAQRKDIIISDDLTATTEVFKVKMGTQWMGKIWNFKFGDYAVVKSKLGWTVTTEKANLLDTKTESKTKNKFSFVLSNSTLDSAIVNAVNEITIKELRSFNIFSSNHFEINLGSDELLMSTNLFSSFITTNSNKNDVWVLYLEQTDGNEVEYKYEGVIRNEDRIIKIIPVSSNKKGTDSRMIPALGFEFIENEQSLCAVQYFGGGAFGFNKNIVWIKSELEPRMKLILSAAMTSLMQLKN
jgi:hypothetical protein